MAINKRTIALGGDHAGFEFKQVIINLLEEAGINTIDKGPYGPESVDYPDFVHPVCNAVIQGEADLGILICGTGNGVAITANKYAEIRCGLCWDRDVASLVRAHNDANVLAMPARFIDIESAKEIVNVFISTEFEGGRHQRRVDKMTPNSSC